MISWSGTRINFDISACPLYVRQAYEAKKWAFVTDYVRLKVVYDHGGIYMDTDVELKKSLEPLLEYDSYFGFEDGTYINTGLGFGAVKGAPILLEMMRDYDGIPFILPDGTHDTLTCPMRNTAVFLRHGLRQDDSKQVLDGNILILPSIFLCPIAYWSGLGKLSAETVSVHWFSASWMDEEQRAQREARVKEMKREEQIDYIKHIPNRILKVVLGETRYEKLKQILKKG